MGKTELGVSLAKKFDGEVISADSRQFYRELNIGTAKPTTDDMEGIPHHFINSLSVGESYTAGNFETEALELIADIFSRKKIPMIVGGSGLYIKAAMEGLDNLPSDQNLRREIEAYFEKNGLMALQHRLRKADKAKYREIDEKNHVRLIRAIEIAELGGEMTTDKSRHVRNFTPLYIGLNIPRHDLYQRINKRVDQMISEGLEAEAKKLSSFGDSQALQTVGYRELMPYFKNEYSKEQAIELIKRNTRRYAKRQLTWFRKMEKVSWFDPRTDRDSIFKFVEKALKK